mmetsp:Transcript_28762/g.81724  ORF Transcript_28762/g.81724 Transcript_28762/m.81724 type:complete len:245 (+) Transcript_28762:524-1258(+)
MPALCDLYAVAAGAPPSMSSSPSASRACTNAVSLCLSATESEAASTTAPMDRTRLSTFRVSSCAKAAGFFRISRSIIVMARDNVPMDSMSSASLAEKSENSFARIVVALLRSASSPAMLPASSSILAEAASASLCNLPMLASNCALRSVAVRISNFLFLEASWHQEVNSLKAFSSASPSWTILAERPSNSSRTLLKGLPAALASACTTNVANAAQTPANCLIAAEATRMLNWPGRRAGRCGSHG